MKKLNSLFCLALSALLTLTTISCNNDKVKNLDFRQYVTSYSAGKLLSSSPVVIFPQAPITTTYLPGSELPNNIIKTKPSVEGTTILLENGGIEFVPSTPWVNGKTYQIDFNLGAVCNVPKKYKHFIFDINIVPLEYTLENGNIYVNDDNTLKYTAIVNCSDAINVDNLTNLFSASYNNKPIDITFSSDNPTSAILNIDNIIKGDESSYLKINANDKVKVLTETEIKIEDQSSLCLLSYRAVQGTSPVIILTFSDVIDQNQNFADFFSSPQLSKINAKSEDNLIYIYPPVGTKSDVELTIHDGIRAENGNIFKDNMTRTVTIQQIKPEIKLFGDGTIVPNDGSLKIPFSAIALKYVDVELSKIPTQNMNFWLQNNSYDGRYELNRVITPILKKKIFIGNDISDATLNQWNDFTIDLSQYIKVEKGVIYIFTIKFKKSYTTLPTANEGEDSDYGDEYEYDGDESDEEDGEYYDYYNSSSSYPSDFEWKEKDDPTTVSYYYGDRFVSRNIVCTSLGVIAKSSAGNKFTFTVTDLESVEPVNNCKVTLYTYQNVAIDSATTDKDGFVTIKSSKKPYFAVAAKGDDKCWLKLNESQALSLSEFDVSGEYVQSGIKGFTYGERGVWRPGDKIFLSLILEDKANTIPNGLPIVATLSDPDGNLIETQKATYDGSHIYCFTFKTMDDATTGYWNAHFQVGSKHFNRTVRIETIKPNRLSITYNFDENEILGKNGKKEIQIHSQWLHGGQNPNAKADINVKLSRIYNPFPKYETYKFDDITAEFSSSETTLFEGNSNSNGDINIQASKIDCESAPGLLKANFATRVFENSGNFSISSQQAILSPFDSYVGIKMNNTDQGWYNTDRTNTIYGLILNPDGTKSTNSTKVKVEIYKVVWRWWWESANNTHGSYVEKRSFNCVYSKETTTSNGEFDIDAEIKERGRYLITAKDINSGHEASFFVYFGNWNYYAGEEDESNATILSFSTEKKKYNVGETVKVNIPGSEDGVVVMSLETGNRILSIKRIPTSAIESTIEFTATRDMCPNVYINLSLIQSTNRQDNDHPIRLYGVSNINVEDPSLKLQPEIEAKSPIRPSEEFNVKISEKSGRAMTYTLAIVDDGLLSITSYKTPNPFYSFYAREALGIRTWDMYNFVYGAYGAKLDMAYAVGGDEGESNNPDESDKNNRFKPVVIFQGPFTIQAKESKTHTLKMPEYIGKVRVMVVAAGDCEYGSAQKEIEVNKPLMLNITYPRLFTPNDEIDIPVTVFAMKDGLGSINVSIKGENGIDITSDTKQTITLNTKGEKIVFFKAKIGKNIGTCKVSVTASSGNENTVVTESSEIRIPNPRTYVYQEKLLTSNETVDFTSKADGVQPTSAIEISTLPPMNLESRIEYLLSYPYGCSEQTTSAAFPQVVLDKLISLSQVEKSKARSNVTEALNSLSYYQTGNGGFAYWRGYNSVYDWTTTYVAHFMLTAKNNGYNIPNNMLLKAISYMKNVANTWRYNDYWSTQEQAYRLYILAMNGTPDNSAMNRLKENKRENIISTWLLAATYAKTGNMTVARNLVNGISSEIKEYRQLGRCFGSSLRDRAIMLMCMIDMDMADDATKMLDKCAESLGSDRWLSTQETNFAIIAAAMYVDKYLKSNMGVSADIVINGKTQNIKTDKTIYRMKLDPATQKKVQIKNYAGGNLHARMIESSASLEPVTESIADGLSMQITYKDNNGNIVDLNNLTQGMDISATITIKNTGLTGTYDELALSYIVPSGFEITNERLNGFVSSFQGASHTDIRDDRFYLHFSLAQANSKSFTFKFNATYAGNYLLPAIKCAAMYDNSIQALIPGGTVHITKK